MMTKTEVIKATRRAIKKPEDEELRRLPFKQSFVYGRVSTPGQIRDSKESIREIGKLVELAKEDGYISKLDPLQVEEWLNSIIDGTSVKGIMEEGQITVNVQDLGISGQLPASDRKGMTALQQGIISDKIGAVYVTEGVSRLSRDRDHILPFQLLKLLKEYQVRFRTPEGVWNPAIERDWEYLADEFDAAIGELKIMNKRMQHRKAQKAARGEFVGEPVPPGFIVPITGRKPNGQYEYGKLQPYPPHAEVDKRLLNAYVRNGGSPTKTMREINHLVFPLFPPELSYMGRLSSLRKCKKLTDGYEISPNMVFDLSTNPKLIGILRWGDNKVIENNHPAAVPEELFFEAFQLAKKPGKAKGRAVYTEPLEWSGLIYCTNHPEPKRLISRKALGYYTCERDQRYGKGPTCQFIPARLLDESLTRNVLNQLDFNVFIEQMISRMESNSADIKLDQMRSRQQVSKLEKDIKNLKALLPCCVDELSGKVDKEKESYYWEQIRESQKQIHELRSKSAPTGNGHASELPKAAPFPEGVAGEMVELF